MYALEPLITIPLLLLLAVATVVDWRSHRIPNALSLGGAVFALILHMSLSGVPGLALAAAGWVVCLVCFLPFYLSGGMAAGDVKLMAAAGAFLGPVGGIAASACALAAGGLIGVACLGYDRLVGSSEEAPVGPTLKSTLQARIPYAGAIAAGCSLAIWQAPLIATVLKHNGAF